MTRKTMQKGVPSLNASLNESKGFGHVGTAHLDPGLCDGEHAGAGAATAAAGLAGRSCSRPSGASRAPAAVVTIAANRWSSPPAVFSSSEHSSTARRPLRCSTHAPREARSVKPISFADALCAAHMCGTSSEAELHEREPRRQRALHIRHLTACQSRGMRKLLLTPKHIGASASSICRAQPPDDSVNAPICKGSSTEAVVPAIHRFDTLGSSPC